MGNPNKDSKPRIKNQAYQALPSGEINKGGIGFQGGESFITVSLININLSVLGKLLLNANVSLKWKEGSFYCFFRKVAIGKVPANYNTRLNFSTSHKASIFSVMQEPPKIVIKVNLKS